MQIIARRRRRWSMLKELGKSISMSPNILGGMLEKNMILTSTQNNYEFESIAHASRPALGLAQRAVPSA